MLVWQSLALKDAFWVKLCRKRGVLRDPDLYKAIPEYDCVALSPHILSSPEVL